MPAAGARRYYVDTSAYLCVLLAEEGADALEKDFAGAELLSSVLLVLEANRNLVLSPKARADSIPGLEIMADDVRCTHGATVGKIDADQVFYLLSRGIPYRDAERLIVEGFFDPIMQRIPFEGVRFRFQDAIMDKMG